MVTPCSPSLTPACAPHNVKQTLRESNTPADPPQRQRQQRNYPPTSDDCSEVGNAGEAGESGRREGNASRPGERVAGRGAGEHGMMTSKEEHPGRADAKTVREVRGSDF